MGIIVLSQSQAAQETLAELGFPLSNTYLLLLDADMLLKIEPEFQKINLTADMYMVVQKNGSLSYYNTRLVRASMPWECVGVTHEYWACKAPKQEAQLKTLWIDDHNDGGCKSDKFERDVRLLTQGLKDEPDNVRYMFYLAQSYKCLGQLEDAIRWYKTRIDKGGWKEEVWYSQMMVGEAYEDLKFWDQALQWYLAAYEYNPERAESLQKIASHYRNEQKNSLAYLFAKHGSRIPYPKNQYLFISDPVYDYQFNEEISIAGYYTIYKDEGFEAADHLLFKKSVPKHIKEQSHKNLIFYAQNIKHAKLKPIEFDLPFLRVGSAERFYPSNPSIQKTSDGYDVICRTVNYWQKGGTQYGSRDDQDPTIRTRNFLLHYDRNFQLLSQREIIENSNRKINPETTIKGLEDCRLIALNNNRWFLATTYDTHPNTIGQSLCKLAYSTSKDAIQVEKLIALQGPDPTLCEKNWLPFAKDNSLYILYGYNPFIIYKVNTENGACETAVQYEPSYDFSRFRGSASPVEFDDGYLFVVHEVVFDSGRHYIHRFVYLDKNFNIKQLSRPFTFLHNGIEYCSGMTIDHAGKQCIITIGYEDQKAYLVFVDLDTIRSLLKPVP